MPMFGLLKKKIILVVEDDSIVRSSVERMLGRYLAQCGYTELVSLRLAESLMAAMALAEEIKAHADPDAEFMAIVDGNMPGGDGDELLQLLSDLLRDQLKYRIIRTGNVDQFTARAKLVGADCIEKPGSIDALLAERITQFVFPRSEPESPASEPP